MQIPEIIIPASAQQTLHFDAEASFAFSDSCTRSPNWMSLSGFTFLALMTEIFEESNFDGSMLGSFFTCESERATIDKDNKNCHLRLISGRKSL